MLLKYIYIYFLNEKQNGLANDVLGVSPSFLLTSEWAAVHLPTSAIVCVVTAVSWKSFCDPGVHALLFHCKWELIMTILSLWKQCQGRKAGWVLGLQPSGAFPWSRRVSGLATSIQEASQNFLHLVFTGGSSRIMLLSEFWHDSLKFPWWDLGPKRGRKRAVEGPRLRTGRCTSKAGLPSSWNTFSR